MPVPVSPCDGFLRRPPQPRGKPQTTSPSLLANHNNINKDYPLGLSSSDLINAGLSDNVAIPEPSTGLAVGGLMLLLALGKKLRSQPSQR
ncbi:MAG TPA: hypothetical protein PLW35_12270 [Verrucomicrobiota bacterium]|nr:hypothetical protein [Verrucomicrobiota bacterium]